MSETEAPSETNETTEAAPESPLLAAVRAKFGDAVSATHEYRGDATAVVARESIVDVATWLRDDPGMAFDLLVDVTAVDYLGRSPRFEVVYHLYSIEKNHRIRLKVPLEESDAKIPTVVPVWSGANWLEREAYDMYGIQFDGHPNMTRIYLYEEFEGHPLRKDYPKERRQPLVGPGSPAAEEQGS